MEICQLKYKDVGDPSVLTKHHTKQLHDGTLLPVSTFRLLSSLSAYTTTFIPLDNRILKLQLLPRTAACESHLVAWFLRPRLRFRDHCSMALPCGGSAGPVTVVSGFAAPERRRERIRTCNRVRNKAQRERQQRGKDTLGALSHWQSLELGQNDPYVWSLSSSFYAVYLFCECAGFHSS